MKDYFFHADSMTVGYNGKSLIREIEIGLNRGEILTLIGPNGAGKSTILRSITRQLGLLGGNGLAGSEKSASDEREGGG